MATGDNELPSQEDNLQERAMHAVPDGGWYAFYPLTPELTWQEENHRDERGKWP